jgi:hypothetical protein
MRRGHITLGRLNLPNRVGARNPTCLSNLCGRQRPGQKINRLELDHLTAIGTQVLAGRKEILDDHFTAAFGGEDQVITGPRKICQAQFASVERYRGRLISRTLNDGRPIEANMANISAHVTAGCLRNGNVPRSRVDMPSGYVFNMLDSLF